jgi:hypothetical protein
LLSEIFLKVDDTKEIMIDNVDKIIDRGVKLDQLDDDNAQIGKLGKKVQKKGKNIKNGIIFKIFHSNNPDKDDNVFN